MFIEEEKLAYFGIAHGDKIPFTSAFEGRFDKIFAVMLEVLGEPIKAQILRSTPDDMVAYMQQAMKAINPYVKVEIVEEFETED